MMIISEGDKVRTTEGEIARITEVLGGGAAFIAEIFRVNNGFGVTIDTIRYNDIASIFVETEHPINQEAVV